MTLLDVPVPHDEAGEAIPRPVRVVRTAVVGLERAGIEHLAVLSTLPECEIVGVCDPARARRRHARGMGFTAPGFASLDKMLAKESPDVVFVSQTGATAAAAVRAALESGAAVHVDRPMASSAAEAMGLVQLAASRELALACGHTLAFEPVFERTRELVAAGALGALRSVRSSYYLSRIFSPAEKRRMVPSDSPGGVVARAASDLLYVLIGCFGMPVQLRATWAILYGELEDELHGMMRLANGVEIGFDCSWSVPGYPRQAIVLELEGDNGKLLVSDDALELDLFTARGSMPAGESRLGRAAMPQTARFDLAGDALYLQDAAFLGRVAGGHASAARADLALDVIRVTEALYASARSGGAVVAVAP